MSTINGLPAHVLLVHAVVVLVPLTSILLILVAFWPSVRRRLSVPTAILAGLTLITVPITTEAGDWLEHHLARTPLLRVHTHLGDTMLPWAIGLFLVAAALAARELLHARGRNSHTLTLADGPGTTHAPRTIRSWSRTEAPGGRPVTVALAALALIAAVGSTVTVYRIGDSGARAAWTGQFSQQPARSNHQTQPAGDNG
jgi:hypothetical protein